MASAVEYDERGRPYIYSHQLGRRIYVSPGAVRTSTDPRDQAFVANTPETPDNFFRTSNWNQYTGEEDRGMNWGNIGSLAVGAYLGGVALPGVLGGGGTAAATSAGSGGAGGVLPSAPLAIPNAVAPTVAAANPVVGGTVGATTAAAGGSVLDRIRRALTDPATLATAGPAIASLMSQRGGQDYDSQIAANQDQLRRLQAITEARMRRVDPLHQAATQLAFGRLPVSSRNGITLTNTPLPE